MYRDDAVSEVVGFSLILGMVILSLGLLSVHAAPAADNRGSGILPE